jgi:hypothetical protein
MSEKKPYLLIFEGHKALIELWGRSLSLVAKVDFVCYAHEVKEAMKGDQVYDLIVLGCNAEGDLFPVRSLLISVLDSFMGPVLVNSSFGAHLTKLIEAGATYGCFKCLVPRVINEILKI